jgi:hypothetical protein
MSRPIVKYAVRIAFFASAVLALACSGATAPSAPISLKKPALKDTVTDPSTCFSGYQVIQGFYVCNP